MNPKTKSKSDGVSDVPESMLEVPQSQSFVPESTLIPESNFASLNRQIPGSESVSVMPESTVVTPSGGSGGERGADAPASALKKNLPFIVLGALAVVGLLAFLLRPTGPSQEEMAAAARAAQASAAEKAAAAAKAAVTPKEIRERDEKIAELTQRVTAMQSQLTTAADQNTRLQGEVATLVEREADLAARVRAMQAAQAEAQASVTKISPKLAKSLKPAQGYTVNTARNGLAWVVGPEGMQVVKVGDDIAGLGPVLRVDDTAWQVQAGKSLISAANHN
jgi:regulator of replication initiation timing